MVRVDRHGFQFTQIKDHIIMQLTIFPLIYVQYFTVHIVWSKRHYRFKCLYNIEFILTYLWRWRTLKNQQRIFEFWTLRIPIGFVSKKLMQLWAVFKRSGFGSIQSGFVLIAQDILIRQFASLQTEGNIFRNSFNQILGVKVIDRHSKSSLPAGKVAVMSLKHSRSFSLTVFTCANRTHQLKTYWTF